MTGQGTVRKPYPGIYGPIEPVALSASAQAVLHAELDELTAFRLLEANDKVVLQRKLVECASILAGYAAIAAASTKGALLAEIRDAKAWCDDQSRPPLKMSQPLSTLCNRVEARDSRRLTVDERLRRAEKVVRRFQSRQGRRPLDEREHMAVHVRRLWELNCTFRPSSSNDGEFVRLLSAVLKASGTMQPRSGEDDFNLHSLAERVLKGPGVEESGGVIVYAPARLRR